jgi:ABC-type transport system involved in multi-copper enzyme maturation permease subunit
MTASRATLGQAPGTSSRRRGFLTAVATIMVKELRSRMRGRRAFVVLTIYLGVLALITYGTYIVVGPTARAASAIDDGSGIAQANASGLIGQAIFAVLSVFQVILVSFIAPAFTAGQISLEREKQTLDLLVTTPLRPSAIVIGKLLTALAFVVLMIVAAVPISAIVLMYGGASIGDILRQQVVLLAMAVAFGAIGIFASALLRRTQAATVATYCTVLALTLGSAMVFGFWTEIANANDSRFPFTRERAPEQLRYLNPMVAMLDIVAGVESTPTRFTAALYELFGQDLASGTIAVDPGGGFVPPDAPATDGFLGSASLTSGYWWPRISLSLVGLAAILTLASTQLVVPAGMRGFGSRRRRAATAAVPAQTPESPAIEEVPEP